MFRCDSWHFIILVSRSTKVTWGHGPRLTSQWPIANCRMFSWVSCGAESKFVVHCSQKRPQTTSSSPSSLGQSSSFGDFEFWPLRRWQTARVMLFYLGALATTYAKCCAEYSNNTLSCSELNREHAGECFRSLRYDTYLRRYERVKLKMSFFAKIWPLIWPNEVKCWPRTKNVRSIARSRRDASTVFFFAKLYDNQGPIAREGRTPPPPPSPSTVEGGITWNTSEG